MAEALHPGLVRCIERAVGSYRRRFASQPQWVGWGPGRVNIIGEHTDYNQGLAMPSAIDRWVVVALGMRGDERLVVRSEDFEGELDMALRASLPSTAPSWQRLTRGCVAEFDALHPLRRGVQAAVAGDVPLGAGLSSSAAVEMAWLNALRGATGAAVGALELAAAGQRVENHHLGLASGLLDQVASQMSRAGELMVVDFESLAVRHVPSRLQGWGWLVLDTGVRRELAGSAYRDRVAECARGLHAARCIDPGLAGFRALRPWHLGVLEETGRVTSARRLRHLLGENRRVRAMERALAAGDGERAGAILHASHASLRDDYQVSCAELDLLAGICESWKGCAGARMVGGGFGGCVLALLRSSAVAGFAEYAEQAYAVGASEGLRCWSFELVRGAGAIPWRG